MARTLTFICIAWALPAKALPFQATTDLNGDLTDLASSISCCPGREIMTRPGIRKAWRWDTSEQDWVIGVSQGLALGVFAQDDTILFWPAAHDYDPDSSLSEQPDFLAEAIGTLAHECLHFKCPRHGYDTPFPPPEPTSDSPFQPNDSAQRRRRRRRL